VNVREHFLAVMDFDTSVPTMKWEMGYWAATLRRWYGEGLPRQAGIPDDLADGDGVSGMGGGWSWGQPRAHDVDRACGFDHHMERLPLNAFACPTFGDQIVEDHGDWVVRRISTGVLRKEWRDRRSLPHDVGWPVSTRDDWERYKAERLEPALNRRLPADWTAHIKRYQAQTHPLVVGGYGFYSTPRILLGEENLLYAFYDNPELIQAIVDDLCNFWIALYDQILPHVSVDVAQIWEDMSFKNGPLISPAMVRAFMLPAYKKLTACWRDHGVKVVLLDTDGDCWSLIPIFLEGGVTGIYPFEVNAGMDVVAVRKAFPRLQIIGGLDKLQIVAGGAAIDAELAAKAPSMLKQGGYIPCLDHYVHPDVSWASFAYYRQRLCDMIG
jgi:Uroporphyrinogen decarboxylase (URO-D)